MHFIRSNIMSHRTTLHYDIFKRIKFASLFHVLFICFFNPSSLSAQEENWLEPYLERVIDQIGDEGSIEYNQLLEQVEIWIRNPILLNQADYTELSEIPFLNSIEVQAILDHRESFGPFISIYELQVIREISEEKLSLLKEICTVGSAGEKYQLSIPGMIRNSNSNLFLKWRHVLEDQEGYIRDTSASNRYLGNAHRYFLRYQLDHLNKLRMGFTMEKDPGEQFFSGNNKSGFDFNSFHFYLRDYSGLVKNFALGDYNVSLGQGLILHNNFGTGKGPNVLDIRKGGRTIRPYTSVDENNYFRGIAAELKPAKKIYIVLFGSSKKRDANVRTDLVEDEPFVYFSSLLESGYHRTPSEISKEDQIRQSSFGTSVKYQMNCFHIAINSLYEHFSEKFQPSGNLINTYRFNDNELWNHSIDYGYNYRNLNLFGEHAYSSNGGFAHFVSGILALDRKVHIVMAYRNYAPDYHASLPNSFGNRSSGSNEKGWYSGVNFRPNKYWTISAFADQWTYPWVVTGSDFPTQGHEYFIRARFYQKRKLEFYSQYNFEIQEENSQKESPIRKKTIRELHRLRNHLSYNITPSLTWKTRLEYAFHLKDGIESYGYMIYQDLIFKPRQWPIALSGRYMLFDTDDYNSRIYAYENDLLYEFYIPAFYSRGSRIYINVRYDFLKRYTFEFRYAQSYLPEAETIGSGLDIIQGQTKTELKAQLRIKF